MKRFLILLTLLLAMLFSCDQPTDVGSNNSNQQTNENQNQDNPITTGTIVGKAKYSNTESHAGIQVTLVSTDGIVAYNSQISSRSRSAVAVMKNVVTSESGEYSFDNVKEGVYTIYASSDDSTEKAVLTNVVVQSNQVVTAADLNLTATGSICGRVTLDSKEDENLGITVVIAGTSYMAVTDSFGFFTISNIPAGSGYQIVIMKGDYCTIWKKESVEAGKENNLGEKNITSQKNPTVSPNTDSSFIWQGSFATSPANPEKYWAYFNTTDGCSYIYDGAQWTLLAQAGKDGADGTAGKNGIDGIDGVAINWQGSFATSPANPEKYWAYFNTTDGCSYIYDGEKWTLLAQAGADGEDGANGNGGGASVEHKIIYELNGGTNNTKNPNSFLEYLTVNLRSPTRDGYYFAGWYENADFSGNRIKGWEIGEKRTDVTLYAKWTTDVSFSRIYSYTLNIKDISEAWGGTTVSPSFSVVLLTDEQVEVCKAASDFKQAPADNPEYLLGAYGSMKITDTSKTGDYAVYGANPVNDVYQYYNGVAATITNTTFTLTVDMTKLDKTQLKALFAENDSMETERPITEDDMVYLLDYKPYVIALGDYLVYEDNYVFTAWSADVMKMEEGATFPTELIEDDPKIQLSDMTVICSNLGNLPITFADDIAIAEFVYDFSKNGWGDNVAGRVAFGICSDESWAQKFTGAAITALDTEVEVTFGADNNNTVAADILEDGKTYILIINAKNNTVKISAK